MNNECQEKQMKRKNANMPAAITASPEEANEEPLSRVVGHTEQKKEILTSIDWFRHSKELCARGLSIPRGILLFGDPGNGKSLFIKEIIRSCGAPAFVYQGEKSNVCKDILDLFNAAKKTGHAIIVFDELNLLIDDNQRVARVLQECMDGVESEESDILVLASTNCLDDIPDALKSPGRFDKLIYVPGLTGKEATELLKKRFNEMHVNLPEDFDDESMASFLQGLSGAEAKSVVNDVLLRHGFDGIAQEMIDESVRSISDRFKGAKSDYTLSSAIHEAGHVVMALAFPEFFHLSRVVLDSAGGCTNIHEQNAKYWPYTKCIAHIQITMAGVLAEKSICGVGSRGCEDDLNRARVNAYNLINACGYSSCAETLPQVSSWSARRESPFKLRHNERKIERLLRHCERKTKRYLRSRRHQVETLGRALLEKKQLKLPEVLSTSNA